MGHPSSGQELQPGTTFAERYRIETYLGARGIWAIFRAFDTTLLRTVALKVLRRDRIGSAMSPEFARILSAARAAAAFSHPGLAAVHDSGEHDGVAFIAVEFIEGQLLREYIGATAEVAFSDQLRWMTELAHVLAALHDEGLVHREVNPDNVVITPEGNTRLLGIATPREGEPVHDATAMDTPGYAAPEQMGGVAVLDGRADQYAWAVTAYELFCGELPWSDGTTLRDGAKAPGHPIPPRVAEVLRRALAHEREDRFASMDELLVTLDESPDSTRPVSPRVAVGQVSLDAPLRKDARPRGRRAAAWALALLVVSAASFAVWHSARRRPLPSAAAAPVGTTLLDLPMPVACNDEAKSSYRQGLVALHAANWEAAHVAFEKAASADPVCPEAQLRLAMAGEVHYSIVKQREHFRQALSLREGLSERDRILLDATSHVVIPAPPDRMAKTRALEEGAKRFPLDAELLTLAGINQINYQKDTEWPMRALEYAQRALAVDPESADAWQLQGQTLWRLRRYDEAIASLHRCVDVSPTAADCLNDASTILTDSGKCQEAATELRKMLTRVPDSARGYNQLGHVLASAGAPRLEIEEALQHRWELLSSELRPIVRLHDLARLAALRGDFERAHALAIELAKTAETYSSLAAHQRVADFSFELAMETGQTKEAMAIAERYIVRREIWMGSDGDMAQESQDNAFGLEPMMLGLLLRQRRLDAAEWSAKAQAWEERTKSIMRPRESWAYRWSPTSDTPAEAVQNWGNRPTESGRLYSLGPVYGVSPAQTFEGRIALMAGQPNVAVELLEASTRRCRDLGRPFVYTQGKLWLGLAKERAGDKAGACEAYGVVLQRWGNAKPRSKTADEARAHSDALGCVKTSDGPRL
ncbi:protein kinase [Pendulispora rubella]|uniref:Protein kinase n=1 Tax=Pendulispora rubella TaxID=2741070 RepID=A0ABZ2L8Z4_9BACT